MSRKIFVLFALFSLLAISLMPAAAQDSEYEDVAVGEQSDRFSWDSYEAFADA